MLAGCASFAVMSALGHRAGELTDWQTVALFRSGLVFLFVGLFARATGTSLVFLRPGRLWIRSLAGSFSLVTGFYALSRLPASTVTTLTNTYPIWVALLSWPMLRLVPSQRVWLAVLGGVTGVYFIQQPHVGEDDLAVFIALISAVSTAIAMLGLHRIRSVHPNAIVVHFSLVAGMCSALAFLIFDLRSDARSVFDPTVFGLLIGVGLTASLGQMFLTRAYAIGDPSRVSVVALAQVVFALIIDVVASGHEVTWTIVGGTLLILAPTAWVMIERRRRKPIAEPEPRVDRPIVGTLTPVTSDR